MDKGSKGYKGYGKGKNSKGKGKSKYNAHVTAEEDWDDAAYVAEDLEEPYADPAHWSADEDPDEVPEPEAHVTDEWSEFQAYVSDEWEKKRSTEYYDLTVDDPIEFAEIECVACLHDLLGDAAWEDPSYCANMIQDNVAYVSHKGQRQRQKP